MYMSALSVKVPMDQRENSLWILLEEKEVHVSLQASVALLD